MTHIKTWFDRARPTLIPGESQRVSESWRALQAVSESLGDLESSRGSPRAHGPHSKKEKEKKEKKKKKIKRKKKVKMKMRKKKLSRTGGRYLD